MSQAGRFVPSKDVWKAALQGCPQWLRRLVWITFAYAIGNFILFATTGSDDDADTLRGFSGHWMVSI